VETLDSGEMLQSVAAFETNKERKNVSKAIDEIND
jgi:hypothetical protein